MLTLSCAYALSCASIAGCDNLTASQTIDLGDNPEAVDLALDEDFFHCVIQPKVVTAQRCAEGGAGDSGGCHSARSALRLVEVEKGSTRCSGGRVAGLAAAESVLNLERIRTTIGVDAEASPFYRRPVGLDSHPREIFSEDSEPAELIRDWLDRGMP
jgi:hypothetical protein